MENTEKESIKKYNNHSIVIKEMTKKEKEMFESSKKFMEESYKLLKN